MGFRIGGLLICVALAASAAMTALAQDDEAAVTNQTLFVRVLDPAEEDLDVGPTLASITITGVTLGSAVLSVDGDLVSVDE
jgi:hypothetical protein